MVYALLDKSICDVTSLRESVSTLYSQIDAIKEENARLRANLDLCTTAHAKLSN